MTARAPPSRIYYSEPRLRQQRFPPRPRNAQTTVESTAPSMTRQQTLTQLDFSHPSSSSRDMDDSDLDYEHEVEQPTRKRKRSKTAKQAEMERQKTLTQIDFFEIGESEDDAQSPMEVAQVDGPGDEDPFQVWESGSQENMEPPAGLDERFESLPPTKTSSSPRETLANPKGPIASKGYGAFSTPRKPIKTEVPSSQSPPDTPLSTQETPSETKRTPLQEIPANVLAMRDQSSPSTSKKGKQRLEIKDSMEDEVENLDPESDDEKTGDCGLDGTDTNDFAVNKSIPKPPQFHTNINVGSESFTESSSSKRSRPSLGHTPQDIARSKPNTITSSQATTADLTPQSPTQQSLPAHMNQLPFSDPTASDTQSSPPSSGAPRGLSSLATEESQLPSQIPEDVTPAASINNTAEIVTYDDVESDSSDI